MGGISSEDWSKSSFRGKFLPRDSSSDKTCGRPVGNEVNGVKKTSSPSGGMKAVSVVAVFVVVLESSDIRMPRRRRAVSKMLLFHFISPVLDFEPRSTKK